MGSTINPIEGVTTRVKLEEDIIALQAKLDTEMQKGENADMFQVFELVCKVVQLLKRLNARDNKIEIMRIQHELLENIEQQKTTYGGRKWMVYTEAAILGLGGAAGVGAFGFQGAQQSMTLAGQLAPAGAQTVDKFKSLGDEGDASKRNELTFIAEEFKRLRQEQDQSIQNSKQSSTETRQSLAQLSSTKHETVSHLTR